MPEPTVRYHLSPAEVVDIWRDIACSRARKSPLDSFVLLNAWYVCFLGGRRPVLVSVWDGDRCLGVYPFTLERKFGATVLNTLYMDAYGLESPLIRDGCREAFYSGLLGGMLAGDGRADVVKLGGLYSYMEDNALVRACLDEARAHCVSVRDRTYCVDLGASLAEYAAAFLSKKVRLDLRRLEKLLAARDHTFHFLRDREALDRMDRFYAMEHTGWKREQGTALLQAGAFLTYTEAFVRACAEAGTLFAASLDVDGLPVAGQFGYFQDGVYNLVRTAYDRAYASLSPSVSLFVRVLGHLIDTRPDIRIVNYYPVSYGYKHKYAHDRYWRDTQVVFTGTWKARLLEPLYRRKMSREG